MPSLFSPQQLAALKTLRDNMFDTLKKPCKVYYQPTISSCTICLSPVDNTFLGNTGIHGGPIPSFGGVCSVCGGSQKIQTENTEIVYLTINWNPKLTAADSATPVPNTRLPYDIVEIEGKLSDLPKIQQAIEIQLDTDSAPITNAKYRLLNDATDAFSILKGIYFIGSLKRVS